MQFSLSLIVERLSLLLDSFNGISLLKGGGPVILVNIYLLRMVITVLAYECDARANHRRAHCIRDAFLASSSIVNVSTR